MSTSTQLDHTSILDPESPAEMARLMVQDRMITFGMQGLFPERDDIAKMRSLLDVGCGSGGWVLDVAHTYPDASVVGIDISRAMIAYNRTQAAVQRLDNAKFLVMDALHPLRFEIRTFDLVNIRFATAFVPRAQWAAFLQNCFRVLRPGGTLRVTEGEVVGLTNSPAVEKIHSWVSRTLHAKGYGFSQDGSHIGILPMLSLLLQEVRCENIQYIPHMLDFSIGTDLHDSQCQNYMVWPQLLKSELMNTLSITEEAFDQTYKQMLEDMQSPSFRGLWSLLTVWGNCDETQV